MMSNNVKLLIVDDSRTNLSLLEKIFEENNKISIVTASSGEEALQKAKQSEDEYALVLLDVIMPGIDGFETAKKLKEFTSTRSTPLIFLTGNEHNEDFLQKGYEVGAIDFLTKSFAPELLKSKIDLFVQLFEQKEQIRRSQREAEQANQMKSLFLANMSHEIRTPLNGLLGMTELLINSDLDEDQELFVNNIYAAGENLLSLLNDILDISKIEAGELTIEEVDFSLFDLLDKTKKLFQKQVGDKQLLLKTKIDESIPRILKGDPTRVSQILNNLIGNAIKFTQQGSISIEIKQIENSAGDNKISFLVQDSGIGIPAIQLGSIFNKFAQADSSITRKFGGTGLGLAICKELVFKMGGKISVKSKEGKGSQFYFEIPFLKI